MGGFFSKPKVVTKSTLSPEQQGLLGPLAEFFGSQVGRVPEGVNDIASILQGNSPLVRSMSESYLRDAILGPSLRAFNADVRPGIEGAFANIGGTLSTRRGKTISDALTRLSLDAQSETARLLPSFTQLALQGVGQREALRFLPTQQALAFALQPTMGLGQQAAGPGWSLLGTALGVGTSMLTGGLFQGLGGSGGSGGGSWAIDQSYSPGSTIYAGSNRPR